MQSISDEAKLQIDAGVALLLQSHLVERDHQSGILKPVDEGQFEAASVAFHPKYGRLMNWQLFSAGAEFLLKGVCLARQLEMRKAKPVPDDPSEPLGLWRERLLKNSETKHDVTFFGVLDDFTKSKGYLHQLCDQMSATGCEREKVLAGYLFLQKSVRNRDAHAYVPNVRRAQFSTVEKLFVEAFNVLLGWLPKSEPAGPLRPESDPTS